MFKFFEDFLWNIWRVISARRPSWRVTIYSLSHQLGLASKQKSLNYLARNLCSRNPFGKSPKLPPSRQNTLLLKTNFQDFQWDSSSHQTSSATRRTWLFLTGSFSLLGQTLRNMGKLLCISLIRQTHSVSHWVTQRVSTSFLQYFHVQLQHSDFPTSGVLHKSTLWCLYISFSKSDQ